jgi:hypothetical protein
MRSIWLYLVCVAALASAGAAYAVLSGDEHQRPPTASAASSKHARVKIAGYVEYLYPGATSRLQLTLRNRSPRRVRVRWVKARVLDASPQCIAANLSVPKRTRLKMKIKPTRRKGVAMWATLADSAPESCQGAKFPLRYKAKTKPNP